MPISSINTEEEDTINIRTVEEAREKINSNMEVMNGWPLLMLVAAIVLVISLEVEFARGQQGGGKLDLTEKGALDPASTHYIAMGADRRTGQERAFCLARGKCQWTIITCPRECPERKPKRNKRVKGCFIDCSSKCETTCKWRKANCNGYGSVCYDPRFVGGDGVMFYFHGAKGGDFALVSDDHLHINAHFIGTRPVGRARDFTWVQSLAFMFHSHTLVVAAKNVAAWDPAADALLLRWEGKDIQLDRDGDDEWRATYAAGRRSVVVERTDELNSVRLSIQGLVEADVKVVPVTDEDDRVHGYEIPEGDAFAHLEMQFRFHNLTEKVEGVLGQTYRPGYVSPVKRGVPMPVLGGEGRYRTEGFLSTRCAYCRFRRPREVVQVGKDHPYSMADVAL